MNENYIKLQPAKSILIIGICTYSVLFFYAGYFFKERTVFLDAAFQLFSILKDNDFAIQINRFGAFFTQLFPLAASKLNLSLTTIAFFYSEGFVLFNFICFLLILLVFRNNKLALALLLFNILMTTHSFYWIQCELMQGIAFGFVFLAYTEAIYQKEQLPSHSLIFLPVFMFFLIFFYPLMPVIIVFGLAYGWLNNPGKKVRYIVTGACFLLMVYLKLKFFKNYYDTEAMLRLDNFYALFPNYFSAKSFKDYAYYFTHDYYFAPIFLLTLILFYLYKKRWIKLLLLLGFYLGFSILMIGTYPNGADQFYLEPQYSILSFFIVLPLSYELLPSVKRQITFVIIIIFIIMVSLTRIWNAHHHYTARLNWFRDILKNTTVTNSQKIIIPKQKVPMERVLMTWGSSYEFWLLSTIEQGISRSIIIEEAPNEFDYEMDKNKGIITKWGFYNYSDLNERYFNFTDTSFYKKY